MKRLGVALILTLAVLAAGCSGERELITGPTASDGMSTDTADLEIQKERIAPGPGPDQEGDPWDDRKYRGTLEPHHHPWDTLLVPE